MGVVLVVVQRIVNYMTVLDNIIEKSQFLIHKMIKVASKIPPRFYFLKETHRHSVKCCTIYPKNITQYSFKKLSKFLMFGIHTGH